MSDAPPSACPEPWALAGYAERTLDDAERAAVEAHIRDCPECVTVVAETIRFLRAAEGEPQPELSLVSDEASSPGPTAPRRNWRWLVAAALVALCLPVTYWTQHRDPLRELKRRAAVAEARPTAGRLAGFPYALYDPARSANGATNDTSLYAEAVRVAGASGDDARTLHARGVATLVAGDPRGALTLLDAAARDDPQNAAYWSDLAACELAVPDDTQSHAAAALEAADRAITLSPSSADGRFNRAVALMRLGRRTDARAEYERFLQLEPHSSWSAEAQHHLDSVRQ